VESKKRVSRNPQVTRWKAFLAPLTRAERKRNGREKTGKRRRR
jgi:hypothetical protein